MDMPSDITRTYVKDGDTSLFVDLLQQMEDLQQELVNEVKVDRSYAYLHHLAHQRIAELLSAASVINVASRRGSGNWSEQCVFSAWLGAFNWCSSA